MNSKNIIIGVLFLTTVAGGIYGWTQHRQVTALGAQVTTLTKAAARRPSRSADAQQRPAPPDAAAPDAAPQQAADTAASSRPSWPGSSAIRSLMQSPKAAPLLAAQQRAMLDSRYAPLFKDLNLPPDQLAKFKDLLVDKQNAARDVMNVAREQGLDPRNSNDRSEIQQLVQQAQADVDNNISTVIGADKLAQLQNYDQTAPQRAVVGQLAQSLSYTSEPLSPEQNAQLVALLAQNAPPSDNNGGNRTFVVSMGGGGGPPGGFGGFGGMTLTQGVPITNDIVNAAQSFLTPAQVDALRQMQDQQAGQQQLQQMFMGAAGIGAGGSGSGGGGSGGGSSGRATTQSRHHHGGGN